MNMGETMMLAAYREARRTLWLQRLAITFLVLGIIALLLVIVDLVERVL